MKPSIVLRKIAVKFSKIIKSSDHSPNDPLLKGDYPGGNPRIEPELTEEIDDLVKDSLNLVILMERAFIEFQKDAVDNDNELGQKFANNALLDLEDIETALTNPALLTYELDVESGLLDSIDHNASMLKGVLDMTLDHGKIAPEFSALDRRVFGWVNELIANADKIHDLAMSQSEFAEEVIADKPVRMVERDLRDPDEISIEDIHPDYDDTLNDFED